MIKQEPGNEASVMAKSSSISYEIDEDEMFMRTIKDPAHKNPKKPGEMRMSAAFMPAVKDKGAANLVDGISMDRMRYITPLAAKKIALSNLSQPQSTQKFGGFLVVSKADIKSIDSLPLQLLTLNQAKTKDELEKLYITTMPDLAQMLSGFDISPLDTCTYCGVLATPMDNGVRMPTISAVTLQATTNLAHAEIFYLWKSNKPNEPLGTLIQELARHLTDKSKKHFDSDPSNAEHDPMLTSPTVP